MTKISAAQCVNLKPSPPITITAAGALLPGSKEWAAVDKSISEAGKKVGSVGVVVGGKGGGGEGGPTPTTAQKKK